MTQHPTAKNASALPRPHGAQATATVPIPAVRWATPLSPVPPTMAGAIQPHRPAASIPPVRMPYASGSVQQQMPGAATQGKQGHAIPPVRIAGTHSPAPPTMAGAVTPQRADVPTPPVRMPSATGFVQPWQQPRQGERRPVIHTGQQQRGATTLRRPAPSTAIQCLPLTNYDVIDGYPTWEESGESWHINLKLGESKNGREIYHVTKEKGKIHYFFSVEDGEFRDEVSPMKARKGTAYKFSALPKAIQASAIHIWNNLL